MTGAGNREGAPHGAHGDPERPTVVVGRIGRPHGVRGDVSVEVRTDEPERRFAPGVVLATDGPVIDQVTVAVSRWHSGRLLVHLEGVDDRSAAEALRGTTLSVEIDPDELPSDPGEYYDHQLVGLVVVDREGARLGEVAQVLHGAQDLLVVRREGADDAMVPFVEALVPEVNLTRGQLVTDLPDGLLDLGAPGSEV